MGSENGCCDTCDEPLREHGTRLVRIRRHVYHVLCWLTHLAPGVRAGGSEN